LEGSERSVFVPPRRGSGDSGLGSRRGRDESRRPAHARHSRAARLRRARRRRRDSAARHARLRRRAARRQVDWIIGLSGNRGIGPIIHSITQSLDYQMESVRFGRTGLKVSRLCLGTMTYGTPEWRPWVLDEPTSRPFIGRALDLGINFFDTADMYSRGMSEEV